MGLPFSVGHPIPTIWNFGEESPGPALVGVGVDRGPAQPAGGVLSGSHRLPSFAYEGARSQMISSHVLEETAVKVNGW